MVVVKLLLEPLPVVPAVAIFGIGHVGLGSRESSPGTIWAHLIDSRPDQLTPERLSVLDDAIAGVHVHHVPVLPEARGRRAAAGNARPDHDP